MQEEHLLERIALNPKVMAGKPVIRGTRLTVEYILNLLAHGASEAEIVGEYEGVTHEDIQACLWFIGLPTNSLQSQRRLFALPTSRPVGTPLQSAQSPMTERHLASVRCGVPGCGS
jgi:uncharacterized protein (DUF433 family)